MFVKYKHFMDNQVNSHPKVESSQRLKSVKNTGEMPNRLHPSKFTDGPGLTVFSHAAVHVGLRQARPFVQMSATRRERAESS